MEALCSWEVPLYLRKMFSAYFTERTAEICSTHSENGVMQVSVTGGVPQGSVVGPLLWNIIFNEVLRLDLKQVSELLGFDTL